MTRAIDVLTLPFCIFVARSYGPSASFDVKDEMRQSEWNMSSATGRVRAATIAVKIAHGYGYYRRQSGVDVSNLYGAKSFNQVLLWLPSEPRNTAVA